MLSEPNSIGIEQQLIKEPTSSCQNRKCVRGAQVAAAIGTTVASGGLCIGWSATGAAGYAISSVIVFVGGTCVTTALGCHAETVRYAPSNKVVPASKHEDPVINEGPTAEEN